MMNNELSAADIAAVTRNNGGGYNDGGWGGGGCWWLIVLFLFAAMGIGGFGGIGGWGGGGALGGGGFLGAELQRGFAEQNIIRKLDEQSYGIADATYALNNTITSGFASAELSRCNQQAQLMQQLFAMQSDFQKCCCETQRAIEGVNYNLATQACETRNLIQNVTRDITDNQNANARAILDALTAQRIEAKDARIAEQDRALFMANLRESQATQNAYLIGYLDPRPVPSYPACPPYGRAGWGGWNGGNGGGNWGGCNPCCNG